ncbi:MAG TPA: TlpA disulfide reductase family protein, partial [Acidimicrobiales bacterium]|nr:TlpA disulfide reductase family protein [Acidimicrobiales bacterium]
PLAVAGHGGKAPAASPGPALGSVAPDGTFSLADGRTRSVSSLRGRPTLLWFVATWCPSCQVGTRALAARIGDLARSGVRVVELELAGDLGQAGPDAASFSRQFAGAAASDPDWTFGVASAGLSRAYDPANYLDVYYLIDSSGRVRYVNSSPATTMGDLLAVASHLA